MSTMRALSILVRKLRPRLKFSNSSSHFKVKNYDMMQKVLPQGKHMYMYNIQVMHYVRI